MKMVPLILLLLIPFCHGGVSLETRGVSLETRGVSLETRGVSLEMRGVMVEQNGAHDMQGARPKPTLNFFKEYRATGTVRLPVAEIDEPFEAWYSASLGKSRIDFYGGVVTNIIDTMKRASFKILPFTDDTAMNVRTCFMTDFNPKHPLSPQSVLPDTTPFELVGEEEVNGITCNKWMYHSLPSNTSHINQTYTFYVYGDQIPVKLVMTGRNIVADYHIDKYIIDYFRFEELPDMNPAVFLTAYHGLECKNFTETGKHAGADNDLFGDIINDNHNHEDNFAEFHRKHNKTYDSAQEHSDRFAAYRNSVRYINSKNRQGLSYRLGVNHLADELPQLNTKRDVSALNYPVHSSRFPDDAAMSDIVVPHELDLRIEGGVNEVPDQAMCGSCWAFATVGALEGNFYKKHGYRVKLSEQDLMDCSWGYGNYGCDGGHVWRAYEWMMDHDGIAYDLDYGPYLMTEGLCHHNDTQRRVQVKRYFNVSGEENLKLALFTMGAVAINMDSQHKSFRFYESGVYYEPNCKKTGDDLVHAVIVVGYGQLHGKPYWIIRNNWTTNWGLTGYGLISREDNNCGVTSSAVAVEVV